MHFFLTRIVSDSILLHQTAKLEDLLSCLEKFLGCVEDQHSTLVSTDVLELKLTKFLPLEPLSR